METKDCILTRRSVRKFTDRKVEHRLVEQIISLAAYAPSWKNTQISRYIAIEDPKVLEEICRTYAPSTPGSSATAPCSLPRPL